MKDTKFYTNKNWINKEYTIKEARADLEKYKNNLAIIDSMNREIEELEVKATSTTTTLSDMPKGNNIIQDRVAEYAAMISDIWTKRKEKMKELITINEDLVTDIEKLEDPYRSILYMKYISTMNLTEIAAKLNYQYKYTCKMHGQAIKKFKEIRINKICMTKEEKCDKEK